MGIEFRCICKDCQVEFGYSEASIQAGATRGLSRPERCPACRRIHSREGQAIGIPQIQLKPIGRRKPDSELTAGRLGKIFHPDRPHHKVEVKGKFGTPDSLIDFGITDDDIRTLFATMQNHQVVVVVGPTGSGKSTFLPYRLMVPPGEMASDLFTRYGQIVITQPRTQATRSIAAFVGRDLHGSTVGAGFDVGFRHRDAPMSDWRNKLVYVTDGTLINWIKEGQLDKMSVIMIDEAHERSLNIDLILGLLKQQLPRYPLLRLIIASATINADLFQNYYGGPEKTPLITFRGLKQYSVEAYFPPGDSHLKISRKVPEEMANKVKELLLMIAKGTKEEGDILGFLPGAKEIESCIDLLKSAILETDELRDLGIAVYPLYSTLPQEVLDRALAKKTHVVRERVMRSIEDYSSAGGNERFLVLLLDQKSASEAKGLVDQAIEVKGLSGWITLLVTPDVTVFDSLPKQIVFTTHELAKAIPGLGNHKVITDRRVIVATNVAETSLTVDGIVYVVDSGLIKESYWDELNGAVELPTLFHSRAGCRQRWGRAGRVRDGEAHMLYTDVQFEDPDIFPAHTKPQIQRSCLETVVLTAKAAGINDIGTFEWIQSPPEIELKRAPSTLAASGALDADGDLTGFGMELQSFMTEIPVASLLVAADRFACGVEMATLAALHQVQLRNLLCRDWRWDFATRSAVKNIHENLAVSCQDDLELYFKVYSIWAETSHPELRTRLCQLFFIAEETLATKVQDTRRQLLEMLAIGKKSDEDRTLSFASLEKFRFILAVTLPKRFLFCLRGGKVECLDSSVKMEVAIEDISRLHDSLPSFFIALGRRVMVTGNKKQLSLSCLVRIDEEWLVMRGKSVGELVLFAAAHFAVGKPGSIGGEERARILADVFYPIKSVWSVRRGDDGSDWPDGQVSLPEPFVQIFNEEKLDKEEDTSTDDIGDIDPLAGEEEKEDRLIAEGEDEEGPASILDYDDDDYSNRLIILPEARMRSAWLDFQMGSDADTCEVVGHQKDDTSGRAIVLLRPCNYAEKGAGDVLLVAGQQYEVEGKDVVSLGGKETALVVSLKKNPEQQFIIGAEDLSFSSNSSIPQRLVDKSFTLMAVARQGAVCLTRLPMVEEKLHQYISQKKGTTIPCTLVELDGIHGHVLLKELLENEGMAEVAYVNLKSDPRIKKPEHYRIAKTYPLFLQNDYGVAHEPFCLPSKKLFEWIEANKEKYGIFYNNRQRRLHCIKPLTADVRIQLATLEPEKNFATTLARLYRHSNKVRMYTKSYGKPMDKAYAVALEEYRHAEVPEYKKGEIVRGRISEIWDNGVFVVLDRGGRGKVQMQHLAWDAHTLIDPRERVNPEQEIEARVLEMKVLPPRREGEMAKILISLSLLKREDFSPEIRETFKKNSVHNGRISRVEDEKGFALAKLESGPVGRLSVDQITHELIEKVSDYLQEGTQVKVKVLDLMINPLDVWNPLRLVLSMKALLPLPKKEKDLEKYKKKGSVHQVRITMVNDEKGFGFAELEPEVTGFIHVSEVAYQRVDKISEHLKVGNTYQAKIIKYDPQTKRFNLSVKNAFIKELQVDADKIKRIVEPGGQAVKEIRIKSGCWIDSDSKNGTISISGPTEEAIKTAEELIQKFCELFSSQTVGQAGLARVSASPVPKIPIKLSITINIPTNKIGLFIGTKGQTVNGFKTQSRCEIMHDDKKPGMVYVRGKNKEDVQKALELITKLIPAAIWDGSMKEEKR